MANGIEKSNIDRLQNGLRKFWNTDSSYHKEARAVNQAITREREFVVRNLIPDKPVLDVACGSGENSKFIENRRYFGFDISLIGLKMAKDYPDSALFQADISHIPFGDNCFNNVICTYSLEHFIFVERALNEMWRVIDKGGILSLVYPNYGDYFFMVPPSLKKKPVFKRLNYLAKQFFRKIASSVGLTRYCFPIITNPDILDPGVRFESDNDTTFSPSTLELKNFFESLGAEEIQTNYYRPVFKKPWLKYFKTNLGSIMRSVYFAIPFFKYQHCGLIVVKK